MLTIYSIVYQQNLNLVFKALFVRKAKDQKMTCGINVVQ